MSSPKSASSLMLASGMLTYFAFGEIKNMAKAGIDVVGSGVENSWNKSEDKFRQEGEAIGGLVGAGAMIYPNFSILAHEQKTHGAWFDGKPTSVINAKLHNGAYYEELQSGGFQLRGSLNNINKHGIGTFAGEAKVLAEGDPLLTTLKSAQSGVIRNFKGGGSKWLAGEAGGLKGFLKGAAPFAAALAAGWAATKALGFVGGIMDQAYQDEHRFRRVHYDNRYINTQQDQMTNYQQLGAAMNNYENRMQSTARIFHSR